MFSCHAWFVRFNRQELISKEKVMQQRIPKKIVIQSSFATDTGNAEHAGLRAQSEEHNEPTWDQPEAHQASSPQGENL